jgi:DNA-binding response OmpR family regulator
MYTMFFQRSGFRVATAAAADEAVQVASDLKPNVILADLPLSDGLGGTDLVGAFKAEPATQDIPVVILSGRPIRRLPSSIRRADLLLEIPIRPDDLLEQINTLLDKVTALPRWSDEARETRRRLVVRSEKLAQQSQDIESTLVATAGRCPDCSATLQWIERGSIAGTEYDFYRWCRNGCGLFCFDRTANSWIRLT